MQEDSSSAERTGNNVRFHKPGKDLRRGTSRGWRGQRALTGGLGLRSDPLEDHSRDKRLRRCSRQECSPARGRTSGSQENTLSRLKVTACFCAPRSEQEGWRTPVLVRAPSPSLRTVGITAGHSVGAEQRPWPLVPRCYTPSMTTTDGPGHSPVSPGDKTAPNEESEI